MIRVLKLRNLKVKVELEELYLSLGDHFSRWEWLLKENQYHCTPMQKTGDIYMIRNTVSTVIMTLVFLYMCNVTAYPIFKIKRNCTICTTLRRSYDSNIPKAFSSLVKYSNTMYRVSLERKKEKQKTTFS